MEKKEDFLINLMRMLGAELHVQNSLAASREMFGRGYFSLGQAEKLAVDQALFGWVAANYQAITPEFLTTQQAPEPVGFRAPSAPQESGKS